MSTTLRFLARSCLALTVVAFATASCSDESIVGSDTAAVSLSYGSEEDPCEWPPGPSCTVFTEQQNNDAWSIGFNLWFSGSGMCETLGEALMNLADRNALYTRPSGGYVGERWADGRYVGPSGLQVPYGDGDTYYRAGEAWISQDLSPNDFWRTVVHEAAHTMFNPGTLDLVLDAVDSPPGALTAEQVVNSCY